MKYPPGTVSIVLALTLIWCCCSTANGETFERPCKCKSTSEYRPVCGSNGLTYPNLGTLMCTSECHGLDISLVHEGFCTQNGERRSSEWLLGAY